MLHPELPAEVARRRTFAIISHPDAGKIDSFASILRTTARK